MDAGIRAILVISVSESKILFFKSFPTVESRWRKCCSPDSATYSLPQASEMIVPLFQELGLTKAGEFQYSRDFCTKQIQAPLFWVPHDESGKICWPAVVIEKRGLLFCAVPFIKSTVEKDQPTLLNSPSVTTAFEVLEKLSQLSVNPQSELEENLNIFIRQWLPFGRPRTIVTTDGDNVNTRRSWLRSRPQLNVTISEEIRAITGSCTPLVELSGTIDFHNDAGIDLNGVDFQLAFNQLPLEVRPNVLNHHLILPPKTQNLKHYVLGPAKETTFTACSYRAALDYAPIGAVYKTRLSGSLLSLFVQLNFSMLTSFVLSSLEVRLNLPQDLKISRTLSVNNQNLGSVSFLRDSTQVVWNFNPVLTGSKLKGDAILTLEAELNKSPDDPSAFSNTFLTVSFTSEQSTISGTTIIFPGNVKFKPSTDSKFRSVVYKVWNNDAVDII